jgi:thioesterase domain-containing protein
LRDDFFELGGDSLMAIELLAEVKTRFGLTGLPVHTLLSEPTVAGCAAIVDRLQTATGAPDRIAPCSDLLVPLGTGPGPPLFLIHPVGGHVYFYRELARSLGPGRTIFGVRAASVEDQAKLPASVEKMAETYVEAIRTVQHTGPFRLAGASFGGTVAFEMARQLAERGEVVGLLALIDTPGPGHMPRRLHLEADIFSYYQTLMGGAVSSSESPLTALSEFREWIARSDLAVRYVPDSNEGEAERLLRLFQSHSEAMWAYVPRRYSGSLTFFKAHDRDAFNPAHPERAWIGLAELGTTVIEVPGNHITMNLRPHVDVLASRLLGCLGDRQSSALLSSDVDGVRLNHLR